MLLQRRGCLRQCVAMVALVSQFPASLDIGVSEILPNQTSGL